MCTQSYMFMNSSVVVLVLAILVQNECYRQNDSFCAVQPNLSPPNLFTGMLKKMFIIRNIECLIRLLTVQGGWYFYHRSFSFVCSVFDKVLVCIAISCKSIRHRPVLPTWEDCVPWFWTFTSCVCKGCNYLALLFAYIVALSDPALRI